MSVIDRSTCNRRRSYAGSLTANMLCAGIFPNGGIDTCQGDSGGPLVARGRGGSYELIGATSFGNGCAARFFPGVYADVFSEWILLRQKISLWGTYFLHQHKLSRFDLHLV